MISPTQSPSPSPLLFCLLDLRKKEMVNYNKKIAFILPGRVALNLDDINLSIRFSDMLNKAVPGLWFTEAGR